MAAAVAAHEQGLGLVRRHGHDGHRHGLRDLHRPGDFYWFLAISVVTGLGLGADYGLPPSILADVINSTEGGDSQGQDRHLFRPVGACHQARHGDRRGGLAAGGGAAGLQPGARAYYGTMALIIVYIVLPVLIKMIAALLIWFIRIEAERGSVRDELRGHRLA